MAKGSSKLGGGSVGGGQIKNESSTPYIPELNNDLIKQANAAGGGAPRAVEGENVEVRVVMKDGSREITNVSIQDTSNIDNLQNVDYIAGKGRYNDVNIYRALASDAVNNARDEGKAESWTEPVAQEGKWTKTDKVPVNRVVNGTRVLDTTTGYVTKIDGHTIYIQKGQGGGFTLNFAGMLSGGDGKTVNALKQEAPALAKRLTEIKSNSESYYKSGSGMLKVLSKNGGRISQKVFKKISQSDFERLAD